MKWEFSLWDCLDAVAIGAVCAVIAFVFILATGVSKQVFNRIKIRLENIPFLAQIIPPVLGGLMIGFTNYALPSTVGNGSMLVSTLVTDAYNGTVSKDLLIKTCFARGALLAISMNCGFIGGFIFPLLTIGVLVGVISHELLPDAPYGLFLTCFISALPAGIAPIPYTLICLTAFLFSLNVYQITPVFIATMVSYLIVSGTGILPTLQRKAQEREKEGFKARAQDKLRRFQEDDENAAVDEEEKGDNDPLSLIKYIHMNREKAAAAKSARSMSPSFS